MSRPTCFLPALFSAGVLILGMGEIAKAEIQFLNQVVDGQANIYGAGRSGAAATPAPGGSTYAIGNPGGVAAPGFILPAGTNRVLTMISVTGTVTYNFTNGTPNFDADGGGTSSSVSSFQGISGTTFSDRHGSLLGVFVNGPPAGFADGDSGSSAALLSYAAADLAQSSYAPLLNQSFFIGDGLTGDASGVTQQFLVPDGATKLSLGLSDAPGFGGQPGSFNDNAGSFTASFQVSGVPEPSSICLFGIAAAGATIACLRRMKR